MIIPRTIHDKTRTKKVSSLQSISHNCNVFQEKKRQECSAGVSGSYICLKEKSVKKVVPVEELSSDNNTADPISPSAMPLKKRPAKKTVEEEEQLSDDGSSDSSPPNLEKLIFLNKKLI